MPKKKAVKKRPAAAAKKRAKSPTKSEGAKTSKAVKRKATPARKTKTVSLGRPKVTGDEKLYLLFREDFHARQVFEFLRAETVRELEQYSPQQIVDRLSAPLVETVQRIRRTLADLNRHLAGDEEFAQQCKQRAAERR